ncbi:FERM domain-containing protein 4B-like isoform X2 [Fundulus heteroclitus]|uniref:FERM domain-containing protein 4B-like isoform X2 n=1 Tax=Fundulus heteroclitus TaxID=8078 RepID=UPI00165BE968|nr:FERM domain-containing protein 4B-like isoform X2 [Fundulus heteroclitus]
MPNLAQPDVPRYAAYQPQGQPTPTAYYVTGYPSHLDPEPYPNRVYRYDDGMEGHYNVNPSYHHTQAAYYRRDFHSHYATDEIDAAAQRFATLQPPRSRPVQRNTEQITKNIQKALVVGHLKEWYQRNNPHHQGTYNYDYDRGSTPSLGYQAMPTPYPPSHRNISYSSASSSGNWRMNNRGMSDYDVPVHESFSYTLSPAPYIQPPHSRSTTSQLFKGSWYSPDGQRRCAFPPTSPSSSSSPPSDSSLPSSSYSPGCRVRRVFSGPAQQPLSRGQRLSKVPFAGGSS